MWHGSCFVFTAASRRALTRQKGNDIMPRTYYVQSTDPRAAAQACAARNRSLAVRPVWYVGETAAESCPLQHEATETAERGRAPDAYGLYRTAADGTQQHVGDIARKR
jgi:hypothetical protein